MQNDPRSREQYHRQREKGHSQGRALRDLADRGRGKRIRPMLGFKRFDNATVTISGIELAEKIKKGQFVTGKFGGRKSTMSELWSGALAA